MPRYLLEATDETGKRVAQRVDAASVEAAFDDLKARGFREICAVTGEIDLAAMFSSEPVELAPEVDAASAQPRRQIALAFRLAWLVMWSVRWFYLAGLAYFVWSRLTDHVSFIADAIVVGLLLVPIGYAFWATYFGEIGQYMAYREAVAEADWHTAAAATERLRNVFSPFQHAGMRAKILAALGRGDEATDLLEPFRSDPKIRPFDFLMTLSSVYGAAHRVDDQIRCVEEMVEQLPEGAFGLVELATLQMIFRQDVAAARRCLERARTETLLPFMQYGPGLVRGMISFETGDLPAARAAFEETLRALSRSAASMPEQRTTVDVTRCYLAMTLAGMGEIAGARAEFEKARPRLVRHGETEILSRTEAVLGFVRE